MFIVFIVVVGLFAVIACRMWVGGIAANILLVLVILRSIPWPTDSPVWCTDCH